MAFSSTFTFKFYVVFMVNVLICGQNYIYNVLIYIYIYIYNEFLLFTSENYETHIMVITEFVLMISCQASCLQTNGCT